MGCLVGRAGLRPGVRGKLPNSGTFKAGIGTAFVHRQSRSVDLGRSARPNQPSRQELRAPRGWERASASLPVPAGASMSMVALGMGWPGTRRDYALKFKTRPRPRVYDLPVRANYR